MGVQWRESLATGIEEIDSQHKELFAAVNRLFDACSHGKGKEEVGNVVEFLGDYVVTHFNAEEKLQKDYAYPEYKAHKQEHDQFVKSFLELKARYETEGPTLNFVTQINRKVVDWLIKHIGSSDKALGAYLKSRIYMSH